MFKILDLHSLSADEQNNTLIGRVVAIHIRDDLIVNGRVDTVKMRPLARLGYFDYTVVTQSFEILRPSWPLKKTGES